MTATLCIDKQHIDKIPSDVLSIVMDYIPYKIKVLLNKIYYKKYHGKIIKYLNINYNIYIDKLLSNDYDFIFNILSNDNINKWISIKRYRYQGIEFKNYLHYLIYSSYEKKAMKCYNIIYKLMRDITGLNGKQHKNKTINRDIIWIR